jgi:hypothetical protein
MGLKIGHPWASLNSLINHHFPWFSWFRGRNTPFSDTQIHHFSVHWDWGEAQSCEVVKHRPAPDQIQGQGTNALQEFLVNGNIKPHTHNHTYIIYIYAYIYNYIYNYIYYFIIIYFIIYIFIERDMFWNESNIWSYHLKLWTSPYDFTRTMWITFIKILDSIKHSRLDNCLSSISLISGKLGWRSHPAPSSYD